MINNWYKRAQSHSDYPRFIAQYREGRFKGQYPSPQIANIPSLRRKWDRGQLGTGRRTQELTDSNVDRLLQALRTRGIDPVYDDVDYYVIRRPLGPRERLRYHEIREGNFEQEP